MAVPQTYKVTLKGPGVNFDQAVEEDTFRAVLAAIYKLGSQAGSPDSLGGGDAGVGSTMRR